MTGNFRGPPTNEPQEVGGVPCDSLVVSRRSLLEQTRSLTPPSLQQRAVPCSSHPGDSPPSVSHAQPRGMQLGDQRTRPQQVPEAHGSHLPLLAFTAGGVATGAGLTQNCEGQGTEPLKPALAVRTLKQSMGTREETPHLGTRHSIREEHEREVRPMVSLVNIHQTKADDGPSFQSP